MARHATKWRAMLHRTAAILIGAGGMVAVASAAQAHDDWHWKKKHRHFVPPGHVYYAPPVVYAPPPVVVYRPRPVYYAPEPTYYGPPPGMNLNFNIPLR